MQLKKGESKEIEGLVKEIKLVSRNRNEDSTIVSIDSTSLKSSLKETIHSLLEEANVRKGDVEFVEREMLNEISREAKAVGMELPKEHQRAILGLALLMAKSSSREF